MENQNQNKKSCSCLCSCKAHTVLSIISLVTGVFGLIFCFASCCYLAASPIYLSGAGIICGVIGIVLSKKANAGIAIAVTGLVFSIAALVAFLVINTPGFCKP